MPALALPDHTPTIVNLTCSILGHFSVKPPHPTLPLADKLLEGNFRHVVLLILDGMGQNILNLHAAPEGFFRRHLAGSIHSTFPPTTVAATTSLQSGRYPIETGWLGWDCYFPMLDKNVIYFRNTDQQGKPLEEENAAARYYPFTHICRQIRDAGWAAEIASPFADPCPEDFDAVCRRIQKLCAGGEKSFVYAYWKEPDHVIHYNGCESDAVRTEIRRLEQQVHALSSRLQDTLLLVTADHGHIDTKGVMLTDYEDLYECLERGASIEPRAMNLFIRHGKKDRFEALFREYFGDAYVLLTKEEVLSLGLFGPASPRQAVRDMIGDYVAVATGSLTIYYTRKDYELFKSTHGGWTAEEMAVPLMACACK